MRPTAPAVLAALVLLGCQQLVTRKPFRVTIDFERESLKLGDPSIAEPDETEAAPPP